MRLSRTSGVPLYRQVSDLLAERIAAGCLGPGDRLPSEAELGVEFGVNRLTVRQAIGELVRAGRLRVRHGVGTFVAEDAPPIDIEVATLTVEAAAARTTSAFSALGWTVHEWLLAQGEHDDGQARAQLGDPPGPLHRVRTLTTANGGPWMLSSYWCPRELAPTFTGPEPAGDVFAALARTHDLKLQYVWRSFAATAATTDDATHLDVAVGSPLLVREGLNWDQHGRPALFIHRRARSDRARFVLRHADS